MCALSLDALAILKLPLDLADRLGLSAPYLVLRRAWPRAVGHLLLEYEQGDGQTVPGQWFAGRADALRAVAGLPAADVALVALERVSTSGAIAAPGCVVLQLRGADARLSQLARLARRPGARLLVHQPGRRAVVRLSGQSGMVYAKVVRPGRAKALAAAGEAARELSRGAFEAPRLLSCDDGAGLVVWSGLPGSALHDLPGGRPLDTGAAAAGAALRALHASPAPTCAKPHGVREELAVLGGWAAHAAAFAPALGTRVAALLPAMAAALQAAAGPARAIHRDFYDKQVLISREGRVGLLDFDTLACGDPALDLANALVHFELRALQGRLSERDAFSAREALLERYRPGLALRTRLPVYADATRLRLACVYALRPRWRHCAEALLERVERNVVCPAGV